MSREPAFTAAFTFFTYAAWVQTQDGFPVLYAMFPTLGLVIVLAGAAALPWIVRDWSRERRHNR